MGLTVLGFGLTYLVGAYRLGQEDYAIVTMRSLVASENNFRLSHPMNGYSCKLGNITNDRALANGKAMNGYTFDVSDCQVQSMNGPYTSFHLRARPKNTKLPMYCADETGLLKADYTESVSTCIKSGEPI